MTRLTWSALFLAALAALACWSPEDEPGCIEMRPIIGTDACCRSHRTACRAAYASVRDLESGLLPYGAAPLPNRRQDRSREWEEETAESFLRPPEAEAEAPVEEGLTSVVLGLTRGSGGGLLEPPTAMPAAPAAGFHNTADTDPSLAVNRAWGRRILSRSVASELGARTIADAQVVDAGHLDRIIAAVRESPTGP